MVQFFYSCQFFKTKANQMVEILVSLLAFFTECNVVIGLSVSSHIVQFIALLRIYNALSQVNDSFRLKIFFFLELFWRRFASILILKHLQCASFLIYTLCSFSSNILKLLVNQLSQFRPQLCIYFSHTVLDQFFQYFMRRVLTFFALR